MKYEETKIYSPINNKRHFEVWIGNNKFFYKGRIYAGPKFYFGIMTSIFFVACSIFFIYYSKIRIENKSLFVFLVAFDTLLKILTCIYFYVCMFTDPGVLPNQIRMPSEIQTNVLSTSNYRVMFYNGFLNKMKFCRTCLLIRPIGTSHCKICNCCIERYDHHCPWVGNCIGRNNYKYFFFFLLLLNISLAYEISFILMIFSNEIESNKLNDNFNFAKNEFIGLIVLVILSITFIFVGILFAYHSYFSLQNITTYVNIKMADILYLFGNPFKKKTIKDNLKFIFCKKHIKRVNFTRYTDLNYGIQDIPVFNYYQNDNDNIQTSSINPIKVKDPIEKNIKIISFLRKKNENLFVNKIDKIIHKNISNIEFMNNTKNKIYDYQCYSKDFLKINNSKTLNVISKTNLNNPNIENQYIEQISEMDDSNYSLEKLKNKNKEYTNKKLKSIRSIKIDDQFNIASKIKPQNKINLKIPK